MYNEIDNLDFIKGFYNLKELRIGQKNNLKNIEPIKYIYNLETLTLYDLQQVDLSPISSLNNLKKLILCQSEIDISPISNLKNIEYLFLQENIIENMNLIYDLIGLKTLRFYKQDNFDLTYIEKLKYLESLEIHLNKEIDFNDLSKLNNLKELIIHFIYPFEYYINDVSPLLKLNNLEKILFCNFSSVNIMPLAESSSLKYIYIPFNSLLEYNDFLDNGGDLFIENGIKIAIDIYS
jgi:hypothetical protein